MEHVNRRILQGLVCGKYELKLCKKDNTGRCVRLKAMSASLLSVLEVRDTDNYVLVCCPIQDVSLKIGTTAVDYLTLHCFSHPSVAVFLTLVAM